MTWAARSGRRRREEQFSDANFAALKVNFDGGVSAEGAGSAWVIQGAGECSAGGGSDSTAAQGKESQIQWTVAALGYRYSAGITAIKAEMEAMHDAVTASLRLAAGRRTDKSA